MKKELIGLCIGLLLITGCDNKENKTTNNTTSSSEKIDLTEELNDMIFIENFEISIPSWEYSESNGVKYYNGDNAIVAIAIGYGIDYKADVENNLKETKTITSLKQDTAKETEDTGYYATKYTGTATLPNKSTKEYISYEITDSTVRGYIIGITKGNTQTEELDEMLQEMISSIRVNVIE